MLEREERQSLLLLYFVRYGKIFHKYYYIHDVSMNHALGTIGNFISLDA